MKHNKLYVLVAGIMLFSMILAACAPAATPAPTMAPTATSLPEPTAEPIPTSTEAPKSIVDIAVADGRFTTLVTALKAAGLVETLQGEGPFTVFAPTNAAFDKLPAGTLRDGRAETYDVCVEALLGKPETFFTSVFAALGTVAVLGAASAEVIEDQHRDPRGVGAGHARAGHGGVTALGHRVS